MAVSECMAWPKSTPSPSARRKLSSLVWVFGVWIAKLRSGCAAPPNAQAVREKAEDVVSRPEYRLEFGLKDETEALWRTILSWILEPIFWFFGLLGDLPTFVQIPVVIFLVVLLIVLLVHMVWAFMGAVRQKQSDAFLRPQRENKVDPGELESSAEVAASNGEYLKAMRLLFKAVLIRIEQSEKRKLRVGITNRELLRRYRKSTLAEPLSRFVELVDRKWYGGEPCGQPDYHQCCEEHSRIRNLTQRNLHGVGA